MKNECLEKWTDFLASARFMPLFMTQLLGVLNDNIFRNALIILIVFKSTAAGDGSLAAIAAALFVLPSVLFSSVAGQLADRLDKARTIRVVKLCEIAIMMAAAAGFVSDNLPILMSVMFVLGAQTAFFGPLKYGILPDHLSETELVQGNALIEAATFIGILVGTIAGGWLIMTGAGPVSTSAVVVIVAIAGAVAAFRIPSAPSSAPDTVVGLNLVRETVELIKMAQRNRPIWRSILGISWFWTFGAVVLSAFPVIATHSFGADNTVVTLFLATFSLGVGTGSIVCGRILRKDFSLVPVPFAAIGLAVAAVDFGLTCANAASGGAVATAAGLLSSPTGWHLIVDLFAISFCGGAFSLPLYVHIQERSEAESRSRMIAVGNVVNSGAMVAGYGAASIAYASGFQGGEVVLALGLVGVVVAAAVCLALPKEFFRTLFRFYFKTFHGAVIAGAGNAALLKNGGVVIVNHQSYLDGCFIGTFLPGNPIFAIDVEQARKFWYLRFIVDILPVNTLNPFTTKTMIKQVRDGRMLVIFPEGRITETGGLMKVYDGSATIADKAASPILPIKIDGFQFHKFSRMHGKLPLRWFPKVKMDILPPITLSVSPELRGRNRRRALGSKLHGVMIEAAFRPETAQRTLFSALLDARRRFGSNVPMVEDPEGSKADYDRLILASTILGRKLGALAGRGDRVGLMLPNSLGAVVTLFALQSRGLVPCMMNFSTGAETMLSACKAAGISLILTSRRFVDKGKLGRLVEAVGAGGLRFIYLEDVRASIAIADKLYGKLAIPFAGRLPGVATDPDAEAVILFTSGSEGTPKGVVLSHRNILSNCAQVAASIDFSPRDKVFNALPVFHSFGLTGGTLLPLLYGVPIYMYPTPLHYRVVPELIYSTLSTIMFATDSFLSGYARAADPYDFHSLRYIFAGAEKVKDETRQVYAEKFAKVIFEGYGVTEASPVLALNTPKFNKVGTVGRLLPGIEPRLEAVPGIFDGGKLLVRGPNIMLGYLTVDKPGVLQPPPGGWHDTGDIVEMDHDRFLRIVGRVKRFAKIAGEMVSLTAAEALAAAAWPSAVHAVVARPDPRKGEQILLVTTQADASAGRLLAVAKERNIAEIMVPRLIHVVDQIPLLGTGKIDYPSLSRMVAEIG